MNKVENFLLELTRNSKLTFVEIKSNYIHDSNLTKRGWEFNAGDLSKVFLSHLHDDKIEIKLLTRMRNGRKEYSFVENFENIKEFVNYKITELNETEDYVANESFINAENKESIYYNLEKVLKKEKCDWIPTIELDRSGDFLVKLNQQPEDLNHILFAKFKQNNYIIDDPLKVIEISGQFLIPDGDRYTTGSYVKSILAQDIDNYPLLKEIGYSYNAESGTKESMIEFIKQNSIDEKLLTTVNYIDLNDSLSDNKSSGKKLKL